MLLNPRSILQRGSKGKGLRLKSKVDWKVFRPPPPPKGGTWLFLIQRLFLLHKCNQPRSSLLGSERPEPKLLGAVSKSPLIGCGCGFRPERSRRATPAQGRRTNPHRGIRSIRQLVSNPLRPLKGELQLFYNLKTRKELSVDCIIK